MPTAEQDRRGTSVTSPQIGGTLAEFLAKELNVSIEPSRGFELGGSPVEKVLEDFSFGPVECDVSELVMKYYRSKGLVAEQDAKGSVIVRDAERKVWGVSITNDKVQSWVTVLQITA